MASRECIVRGCANRSDEQQMSFFGIPSNQELSKKWKANLGIPANELCSTYMRVCELHFEPKLIGKGRLVRTAIPTLNLGFDGIPPYLEEPEMPRVYKCCAIKHCRKPCTEVRMFRVPLEPKIREKWLSACNIPYNDNKHLRICEEHFEREALGRRKLKTMAFPIYNLIENKDNTCKEAHTSYDELLVSVEILTSDNFCEEDLIECSLDDTSKPTQTAMQPDNTSLEENIYVKQKENMDFCTLEEASKCNYCLLSEKRLNMLKTLYAKKDKFRRTQNANFQKRINNMKSYIVQLKEELKYYKQNSTKK